MFIVFVFAVPAAAGLLAWRNMRSGRSDRRGAFRLAAFLFLFTLLDNLFAMHHVPTLAEFALLFAVLRYAVALGAGGWLLYIAFEPLMRKRTPESLISWNRLLDGRFRDPMVGGHLLIGVGLGVVSRYVMTSLSALPFLASFAPLLPWSNLGLLSLWFWLAIAAIPGGLSCSLILNLIAIPARRKWLAATLFVLVMTLVLMPSYGQPSLATTARLAIMQTTVVCLLVRFGVLTAVASVYTHFVIQDFPLTTTWSAWYAPAALLGLTTLLAIALFGFAATLSGRGQQPREVNLEVLRLRI